LLPARPWRSGASARIFFIGLVLAVILLIAVPALALLIGSLWNVAPGASGGSFTVSNYEELLGSLHFWTLMFNSLLVGVSTAVVAGVIGLCLAWLFVRSDLPHAALWLNLLTVPLYLSPLMLSLAWIALAAPRVGFINAVWNHWTGMGNLVNVYSVRFMVWILASHLAPYVFLSLIGPLRAMDASLEEVSLTLGGSAWRTFRKVTLPLLWPALLASGIMVTILAAENFAVPTLLGRPISFSTVPSELYLWLSYEPTQPNLAATAGAIFLLLSLAGVMLYRRVIRNAARYQTVVGKPKPARQVALGRARKYVLALLLLYFLIAVVIPVLAEFHDAEHPLVQLHAGKLPPGFQGQQSERPLQQPAAQRRERDRAGAFWCGDRLCGHKGQVSLQGQSGLSEPDRCGRARHRSRHRHVVDLCRAADWYLRQHLDPLDRLSGAVPWPCGAYLCKQHAADFQRVRGSCPDAGAGGGRPIPQDRPALDFTCAGFDLDFDVHFYLERSQLDDPFVFAQYGDAVSACLAVDADVWGDARFCLHARAGHDGVCGARLDDLAGQALRQSGECPPMRSCP
jgi:ABC-type spermidine/putrescine transport system permease subunit I